MDSGFWFEAGALLPSIGVGLLFWIAIRSLLRADRREREAEREAEREFLESRRSPEES
jgi:hypothetical protein